MNHCYRLSWNDTTHTWVPVAEFVSTRGKPSRAGRHQSRRRGGRSEATGRRLPCMPPNQGPVIKCLTALIAMLLGGYAFAAPPAPTALPSGGSVTAGQASISTAGNDMTINQASDKAILNWQSFNIGEQASVTFNQPGRSSVALNRVSGADPSQIYGNLNANGQVFLVNTAGVYFGPGSRVEVGGLAVSTQDIHDQDFLEGNYVFESPYPPGEGVRIDNQGNIRTADGGYIAFLSPQISNTGELDAQGGAVAMAAGSKVRLDFNGDSLINFSIEQGALEAEIANGGAIRANDGIVKLSARSADNLVQAVVNNTGVIEARSISKVGGRILIGGEASTLTTNSGRLDVSSAAGTGGRVEITGELIELAGTSQIDATGATGGGTVLVGGDWQGGGDLYQATRVSMASGVTIDANAQADGDGGTVVVWSDIHNAESVTAVHGVISATGGTEGGDGGRVETSGHVLDLADIAVNAGGPRGERGQWLLDPVNINVGGGSSSVSGAAIASALATTNVTLDTSGAGSCTGVTCSALGGTQGDINIFESIVVATQNDNALTFKAEGSIVAHTGVNLQTNGADIIFWANSENLNGGYILTGQNVVLDSRKNGATTGGGNIHLAGGADNNNDGYPDDATAGVNANYSSDKSYGILLGNAVNSGVQLLSGGGNITLIGGVDSNATTASVHGIGLFQGYTIDAGSGGNISLHGYANNASGSTANYGLDLMTTGYQASGGTSTIKTDGGTVDLYGESTRDGGTSWGVAAGGESQPGLQLAIDAGSGSINIAATGLDRDLNLAGQLTAQTVTLTGSGTSPQGITGSASSSISATNLLVKNATTVALNSGVNNVDTLAASGVGAFNYVDADALTIGSVGGVDGLTSTGNIDVEISTGNLTIAQDVSTTGNLTLASGTGGNIKVSGTPDVTVGGLGILKTTSVGDSDLDALIQPGKYYYGTANPTGAGLFGQSAETPTATISSNLALSMTYGDAVPLITTANTSITGLLADGDAQYQIDAAAYSGANKLKADTYTLSTLSTIKTHLESIGYGVTVNGGVDVNQAGSLTVSQRDLQVTGVTAVDRAYNNETAVSLTGMASISPLASDLVTLAVGSAAANMGDEHSGTSKAVTVTGYSLTGNDASNYNLLQPTGLTVDIAKALLTITTGDITKAYDGTTGAAGTASEVSGTLFTGDTLSGGSFVFTDANAGSGDKTVTVSGVSVNDGNGGNNYAVNYQNNTTSTITPRTVSLTASKTYDGTTDLTGYVSITTGVGSEILTYAGATASDAHVATAGKYISALTLQDGSGLASNYQLPDLTQAGAGVNTVSISAAILTPSLTNTGVTKTYDGTTNAPSGFVPNWSLAGLVAGDTDAVLAYSDIAYDDQNVSTVNNQLAFSGLSLTSITGGSQVTDYVLDSGSKSVAATISPASLVIRANNDARFFSQTDTPGYAGASYSGFVNGETTVVLNVAGLVIARSGLTGDGSTDPAGSYVLTPSGVTANNGNYTIDFQTGSYVIVPANQLLVKVGNLSLTYGDTPDYSIVSAEYLASDNTTINTVVTTDNGNSFVADGVDFDVSAIGTISSNAGKIAAGSYQLAGTVTSGSSGNFSNNLVVVGALDVAAKVLTASVTGGISKTYDGTTAMSGVSLALSGKETGDIVTVSGLGAFDSKNTGSGVGYTINNLALSGGDAGNYYLVGGSSFTGSNGEIMRKAVVLDPQAVSRAYNGNTSYTPTASDLGYLTGLLGVSGDSVTAASLNFDDKNVGTGKTLSLSAATIDDGNGGNNYTVTFGTNSTSAITRLDSVTWIGGATGNWFDPANWANGAVPDLANVANVVIPSGVTVSFDTSSVVSPADASQLVSIDSLGTSGSLTQQNGALNVGNGGVTLNTLTQNGGSLTSAGAIVLTNFAQTGGTTTTTHGADFSVNGNFSQGSSGSVVVDGNTHINDGSGGTMIGNLTTQGNSTITSTGGPITQAPGTTIVSHGSTTLSASNGGTPADIVLDGSGNNFVGRVDASGANITLVDGVGDLVLGNIAATGLLDATTGGTMDLNGTIQVDILTLVATSGDINQSSGTLTVVTGPTHLTAGNAIRLDKANDFNGTVNIPGAGSVLLNDINDLTLGDVASAGDLVVTASGNIGQATGTVISTGGGASLQSSAGIVSVSQAGNIFTGGLVVADINHYASGRPGNPADPTPTPAPQAPTPMPVLPESPEPSLPALESTLPLPTGSATDPVPVGGGVVTPNGGDSAGDGDGSTGMDTDAVPGTNAGAGSNAGTPANEDARSNERVDEMGNRGAPTAVGYPQDVVIFRADGKVDISTRGGVRMTGVGLEGTQVMAKENGVVIKRERPVGSAGKPGSRSVVPVFFLDVEGIEPKGRFVIVDGEKELSVIPALDTSSEHIAEPKALAGEIRFDAKDDQQHLIGFRVGYAEAGVVVISPESPLGREMVRLRLDLVLAMAMVELQKQTNVAIEDVRAVFFQLNPAAQGRGAKPANR